MPRLNLLAMRRRAVLAALLMVLATASVPALAQEPHLGGVLSAPAPIASPSPEAELSAAASWKAVYVVGEVDGTTGPTTLEYVAWARQESEQLRALGFTVVEFYPPNNSWGDIVAAAADAQAIIYAGHGIRWGDSPTAVGGMRLRSDETVTPDQIGAQLHMAPGAVAILNHVCYSAGTATEDTNGTSFETARQRVAQYSLPFLDAGLSGYYANWYYGFPLAVLTSLAQGQSLGEAYQSYQDYNSNTAVLLAHPLASGQALWLDYDDWAGWEGLQYDYAFAGTTDLHLGEASGSQLAVYPSALDAYALPGGGQQSAEVAVTSDGSVATAWTASTVGGTPDWLSLEAMPDQGRLRLTLTPPAQPGTYEAEILLQSTAGDVAEVRLPVSLRVGNLVLLPLIGHVG